MGAPPEAKPGFNLTPVAKAPTKDETAAMLAYSAQAQQIAAKLLFVEFAKHPDRVHHLKLRFLLQVDAQGRPHNVKITAWMNDKWIENTARQTLTAAKFPPIPKKIVQVLGEKTPLGVAGDVNAQVSR